MRRANDKEGIIKSGIRAFDEIYGISSKEVIFKCLPERIQITPFKDVKPEWWDFYNEVKHDISNNLSKATLNAVRDALAGAFLLNVIHRPSRKRLFKYGLIRQKYDSGIFLDPVLTIFDGETINQVQDHKVTTENPFIIETPLFIYDYEKVIGVRKSVLDG